MSVVIDQSWPRTPAWRRAQKHRIARILQKRRIEKLKRRRARHERKR